MVMNTEVCGLCHGTGLDLDFEDDVKCLNCEGAGWVDIREYADADVEGWFDEAGDYE